MAVDNIYYLDQFTKWIVKTNSDKTVTEQIEDISPLETDEALSNVMLSASHIYLFGDTAKVLRRPLAGGAWETILDAIQQVNLLALDVSDVGLVLLNGQNSRHRSHVVMNDGYVYIAYSSEGAFGSDGFRITHVLCFNGTAWSKILTAPREFFFGWADLNFSTNLVGLKTALTESDNLRGYTTRDMLTQVKVNSNYLRMFQTGAIVGQMLAPTNLTQSKITTFQMSLESNGSGYGNLLRENGEVIGVTATHLYRILPNHTVTIHPLDNSFTCGNIFVEAGNYVVIADNIRGATRHYIIYNLTNNTYVSGSWSVSNYWTTVNFYTIDSDRVLVFNVNESLCSILHLSTNTATPAAAPGGFIGWTPCTLSNGDVLFGAYGMTPIQQYRVATNDWVDHTGVVDLPAFQTPTQLIRAPGQPWNNMVLITPTYGTTAFIVFDPTTSTTVYTSTLTRNDLFQLNLSLASLKVNYPYLGGVSSSNAAVKLNLLTEDLQILPLPSYPAKFNFDGLSAWEGQSSYRLLSLELNVNNATLYDTLVSFVETQPINQIANFQAVTAVSPTEVYCATVKAESWSHGASSGSPQYNQIEEPALLLFHWDGSTWTQIFELSDPQYTWRALVYWGEWQSYNRMPYCPLLMSSRQVAGQVELVMLRDTVESVFLYTNGVMTPSVMQQATGKDNVYRGAEAPSIPYVDNTDICSVVSQVTSPGDNYPDYPNEVKVYAEARLQYKPDLSLYALIRNN